MVYDIADIKKASVGKGKVDWAESRMPVLGLIKKDFRKSKPLRGYKIGACLHITPETANLAIALTEGGAKVALCPSNPLSTQNDVAAYLVKNYHIPVFAKHGESKSIYHKHVKDVLASKPDILMDDGADLVSEWHKNGRFHKAVGSTEETTTGVIRLKAIAGKGALKIPVIAVNESLTKHLFDNRYGTGQSTIDGILRATNILLAGIKAVVCGYGWCGRGIAERLRGMGAIVTITEVDPVRALQARMDGFNVDTIGNATGFGKLFITATGNKHVISLELLKKINDGAIVANAGHFNVEFDYEGLIKSAKKVKMLRDNLEEILLRNGKRIFVLAKGRLVNLVSAEGHPSEVMDLSFANQALAAQYLINNHKNLAAGVHKLPDEIDDTVARLKLAAMGIKIDKLTSGQHRYLSTWIEGT